MSTILSQCPSLAFNTTVFNNSEDILSYLDVYMDSLYDDAQQMKQANQDLADQCFGTGLLTYIPFGGGSDRHLLLLGGMGPLAGAFGMKECLTFLEDTYSMTLFQACFVPKRDSELDIVTSLYEALEQAISQCPAYKSIDLIVLCNSAHPYMVKVLNHFYHHSVYKDRTIRFHSFKESVEKKSSTFGKRKCIALQTNFAASVGIYAQAQCVYSLDTIQELSAYQKNLALAIEGVKSFDKHATLLNAIKVFQALKDYGAKRLLLGCTELPIIVDALKKEAPQDIQEYLSHVTLFDPLMLTLQALTDVRR